MKEKTTTLDQVLKLSQEMLTLSARGERAAKDDSCLILYSIMRDNAYRIINHIKKEKIKEKNNG